MKKLFIIASYTFCSLLNLFCQGNISNHTQRTQIDKVFILIKYWSDVRYHFAYYDKLAFNPYSLYSETLSQIFSVNDDGKVYKEMLRFSASLNDGYTELIEEVKDSSTF